MYLVLQLKWPKVIPDDRVCNAGIFKGNDVLLRCVSLLIMLHRGNRFIKTSDIILRKKGSRGLPLVSTWSNLPFCTVDIV